MSDVIDKAVQLLEDDQYTECFQVMAAEIERLRAELQMQRDAYNQLLRGTPEFRASVIEECARVAEEYSKVCQAMPTSVIDNVCRGIAADIRAMKEKG